jgi:hypothetical protein
MPASGRHYLDAARGTRAEVRLSRAERPSGHMSVVPAAGRHLAIYACANQATTPRPARSPLA